jgi:hypothetical protein
VALSSRYLAAREQHTLALCTYIDKRLSDNHVLTQHAAKAFVNCVLPLTLTLDIFVLRRKQIINLIENRCFVLATVRLVGSSNSKIKQVVVDSWIATEEVPITQDLSNAENFADLLTFT